MPSSKRKYKALPVTYEKKARATPVQQLVKQPSVRQTLERIILSKQETKFVDNTSTQSNMPLLGQTVALSTIAQGTGTNQRVGNHIYYKYIHARFCVQMGSTTTTDAAAWRFAVVLDKQPNGNLANFSDIWDMTTADAVLALRTASTYGERFKVLRDVTGVVTAGGDNYVTYMDLYIPLDGPILDEANRKAEYLTANANVAGWASNHILFAFGCGNRQTSGPASVPTIAYTVRLAYKDG